jgi:hypothetical protein
VLTVAVKVLTERPLVSRPWAKFSNRYLWPVDEAASGAHRLTPMPPQMAVTV